jgi:acyl-CoA synthetase (AMP-forming)/AMP-acid ligase II
MTTRPAGDEPVPQAAAPLLFRARKERRPKKVRVVVTPQTLVEVLHERALLHPENRAYAFLADGDTLTQDLSYGELGRRARSIGAWLQEHVPVGSRALLIYPPGLDFVAGFLGCLYAGVVAVPVYPPHPARLDRTPDRLWTILKDCEARVALTSTIYLPLAEQLPAREGAAAGLVWLATDTLGTERAADWRNPGLPGDALAFLQYTSGSTSVPKGVRVTHANLLYNQRMIQTAFETNEEMVVVGWLPLYHDMGLIGNVLHPLYLGVSCVLMPPLAFLQRPFRWLKALSDFKGTTSGAPNFAYDLCARRVTEEQKATLDLSSWTVAYSGAEPVRGETLDRFAEAFEPCGFRRDSFFPCYGLAEGTLLVTGGYKHAPPVVEVLDGAALERHEIAPAPEGSASARRVVGCGQPLIGEQVAIVEPETRELLGPDRVGEIWVAGPNVADGYWKQEEETRATFGARLASGEGPFLRTGDLGFFRGPELFVTGRLKDLIILDGRNHYPQDIELTAERSHPSVRQAGCAAFSIDGDGGETVVVVAEVNRRPQPGAGEAEREAVVRAIRQAVAAEHDVRVGAVALIPPSTLPKTSSGKVQRRACRQAFLDGVLTRLEA